MVNDIFPGSGPVVPLHDGSAPPTSGYPMVPVNPAGNSYEPERTFPPAGDAERRFHIVAGENLTNQPLRLRARTLIFDNPTGQWYYIDAAGQYCPPYQYNVPFRLMPTEIANIVAQTPPAYVSAPLTGEVATARYLDIDLPVAPLPFDNGPLIAMKSGLYYGQQGSITSGVSFTADNQIMTAAIVVYRPARIDRIGLNIQTIGDVGSTIGLGVYSDLSGYPGALLFDAGGVVSDALGYKEITVNELLPIGVWWLAANQRNAPVTRSRPAFLSSTFSNPIMGRNMLASLNGSGFSFSALSAFPATFPAGASSSASVPYITVRAA